MNIKPPLQTKRLFKEADAAKYINMSRSFLRQDRMNGVRKKRTPGPRYIRIGRTIRYDGDDLDEWLDKNRVNRNLYG